MSRNFYTVPNNGKALTARKITALCCKSAKLRKNGIKLKVLVVFCNCCFHFFYLDPNLIKMLENTLFLQLRGKKRSNLASFCDNTKGKTSL